MEVKLRQILQPMSLPSSEILEFTKVDEVFVIGNHISRN